MDGEARDRFLENLYTDAKESTFQILILKGLLIEPLIGYIGISTSLEMKNSSGNNNIWCQIFGVEESPQGMRHRCHAELAGLDGNMYPKEQIEDFLRTKGTQGGTWHVAACNPLHDGTACETCRHRDYRKAWPGFEKEKRIRLEARSKARYI